MIVMKPDATEEQIQAVVSRVEQAGARPHLSVGDEVTLVGAIGIDQAHRESLEELAAEPGVEKLVPISKPYKLASREFVVDRTVVRVGGRDAEASFGDETITIIAGPCSVESSEMLIDTARVVGAAGARMLRGGAFKPRTSPYSFQGLGEEGLKILAEVRQKFGLLVVTETIDPENVDLVERYADILQVGARNMQNFSLLRRVGRSPRPVLLKRGMSATLEEFLMAAEYILAEGNYNVILCERGVRTFADHTRNTLDLSVVPAVKRLSHLPIIVDPSHGTGKRDKVTPMARGAVAVGADGLMIEVHPEPDKALSDGYQSLDPPQFDELMAQVAAIAPVVGRALAASTASRAILSR